jgi:Spy/CpxP family protein refolding chaperone
MKRNITILAVIFSVALNVAFLVGYGVSRFGNRSGFAYENLDLSPDQRVRIEAGRDGFLRDLNEIGGKIIEKQVELIDVIAADPTDRQAIAGKFQEIHSIQQSMQRAVMEHLLDDKQILTPAQRTKLFAVLKSRIRAQGAPGPPWLPAGERER